MIPFDRRQKDLLDLLLHAYARQRIGRRAFLRHAVAAGLTASAAAAALAACDASNDAGPDAFSQTTVDVLNVWSGEEQDSFRAVVTPFTRATNIRVNLESTRDLDAALTIRIRGNEPPDIAILPNPGKMRQLAAQNKLIRLDTFLNMREISANYDANWIQSGSYNGGLYALFYKVANKSTIWYNPTQLQHIGGSIPSTWSELISLSNTIVSTGKYPWSMGVESGSASGWPASDWIAEIYLKRFGPDNYNRWVNHQIPWTDDMIKSAFLSFGEIVGGKHYIHNAPQSILSTNYQTASYAPFSSPAKAYLYYLGDFTAGFIATQFPQAKPGTDFNFFPFPTFVPIYKSAVTAGADVVVALKDNSAVHQLIQYLATARAQSIWVQRGGFTSANKAVDLATYPNPIARASARLLNDTDGATILFGAGDMMPPVVQQAFWKGTLTFIDNPRLLDTVLLGIEAVAQQAYAS